MYNEYPRQEQAYQQEQAFHTNSSSTQHGEYIDGSYASREMFPPTLPHNDIRIVAALTYAFGWFSGLLFAIFNRNPYVRYHAFQSLIFFGTINIIDIGMLFTFSYRFYPFVPFLTGFVVFMVFMLLNVVAFVAWIVGITQAYRGSYYRLPIVGNMVKRMLNIGADVK